MSQQTVLPIPETKTVPEVPVEKQVFPKIVPSPQVVIEIVGTSKKTFSQFVDTVAARWRALPRETKARHYTGGRICSHFCDYDGDRVCACTTCREETGSRGSKIVLLCLSPVSELWWRVRRSYTSTQ